MPTRALLLLRLRKNAFFGRLRLFLDRCPVYKDWVLGVHNIRRPRSGNHTRLLPSSPRDRVGPGRSADLGQWHEFSILHSARFNFIFFWLRARLLRARVALGVDGLLQLDSVLTRSHYEEVLATAPTPPPKESHHPTFPPAYTRKQNNDTTPDLVLCS